jgi:hypothetical protein
MRITTTGILNTTMVLALLAAGCGDDGGGDTGDTTAASTGGDASTGEAPTTTGSSDDGTTDATTGGDALTPDALAGHYVSAGCEAYPDGMGGTNYLTRDFTLTTTTWHLDLVIYMDMACTTALFSAAIDGPYTLGGAAAVAGATAGEFAFTTNVWTAHQQFMADTFTMQGCGADPWMIEVPQDVTTTGCIGVAHPIADCPKEYDIVSLADEDLYFGERITDLCAPTGRPAALGTYPVVRM